MRYAIGLCGAHRTGKTTLALQLAKRCALPFARTSTTEVFAQNGLNPAHIMDFATRLWIQKKVLHAAQAVWRQYPQGFVTDRTPLDFISYTLADIQGHQTVDSQQLAHYIALCFTAMNEHFSHIIAVQPGIPLVYEAGKAALSEAYIEHLNTLILGLGYDERTQCPVWVIPRNCTALEQRTQWIINRLHA